MEFRPQQAIVPPPAEETGVEASAPGVRQWLVLGAATATCVLLMAVLANRGPAVTRGLFNPVPLTSATSVLLLLGVALCAVVLHEAGHLLAAIACRFEVLTVCLGVVRFSRVDSGWRVGGRRKRVFTGSVTALPRSNEFWRERMLVVVAAGPVFTLAGAVAAAWLWQVLSPVGAFGSGLLRDFFQLNLLIFCLGLVPNSARAAGRNDAGLLLALWKDGEESNQLFFYHLVVQHQRAGFEPREFPLWLVTLMATFEGRAEFRVLYASMLASWAFDRGDYDSGNLWDAHALRLSEQTNAATRQACLANSACFDLAFRNDRESAKAKLDRIEVSDLASPSLQHRVLAARDLACGHVTKSLAEVAAARAYLPGILQSRGFDCFLLKHLHASALALVTPLVRTAGAR